MCLALLVCFVLCVPPLSVSASTAVSGSESGLLTELANGRWALLFLDRRCESATSSVAWFSRASDAFPEMRFLVVASGEILADFGDEFGTELSESVDILEDPQLQLSSSLELTTYPACLISVDGVFVRELIWPFSEAGLFRSLAESLLVEVVFPDPTTLVGSQAPSFEYEDCDGIRHSLADLSLPVLLVFMNPDCYPCLSVLPVEPSFPAFVSVAIVLPVGNRSGIDADRFQELVQLQQELGSERTEFAFTSRDTLVSYSIAKSPTLILVDSLGTIIWVAHGVADREATTEALQDAIDSLMEACEP